MIQVFPGELAMKVMMEASGDLATEFLVEALEPGWDPEWRLGLSSG
jgi:hypothetical protein